MHPYKRSHKPIRHSQDQRIRRWLGRAGKATSSLWKDVQTIWSREPPFPASVRVLISLVLAWILIMPFFYVLIPPLATVGSIYILGCEELPVIAPLPALTISQRKLMIRACKDLIKKATFRLSMLVTFYDYVQTFRALGAFNMFFPYH